MKIEIPIVNAYTIPFASDARKSETFILCIRRPGRKSKNGLNEIAIKYVTPIDNHTRKSKKYR
jgi:hypothetical protein